MKIWLKFGAKETSVKISEEDNIAKLRQLYEIQETD